MQITYKHATIRHATKWIISTVISFFLLYSALSHLNNPYRFLDSVYGYRLFPRQSNEFVSLVLPFLHISISIQLITGVRQSASFSLGMLLFGVYAIAQAVTLSRGIVVNCGCFSDLSIDGTQSLIGARSIGLTVGLGVLCGFGRWLSGSQQKECQNGN